MTGLFLFFFSSRRRHTRSLRDWSSDVCSSDLLGEDAGVPPPLPGGGSFLLGDRAELKEIDHQEVAGLGAHDLDGAAEHVSLGQVDVSDVIGRFIVPELRIGPFATLQTELGAGPYERDGWDVRVPTVVPGDLLIAH